ncbi:MAG: hypothetical protein ACOZF2_17195 [Thermodesulfobacteriota bacterium]
MDAKNFNSPASWPHPGDFFSHFQQHLIAIYSRQLVDGSQTKVRFQNGYGVNILDNRFREVWSEIAVLEFFKSGIHDFTFTYGGLVTLAGRFSLIAYHETRDMLFFRLAINMILFIISISAKN